MFAHVDINNFYVSCQRLFQPELNGKIVVVLSNNDGCVIARSNEAKDAGLKMGDAEFIVRGLLKEKKAFVFSSNYPLYADMSARVMNNLARFTPQLEVYSIDEAFMSLAGIKVNLEAYAHQINDSIRRNTGLPITVGVGATKSLAKLANKYAKKLLKPVLVLDDPEYIAKVMEQFEIEDLWGVGSAYFSKLSLNRVTTAADFRALEQHWVRKHMTIQGLRLWKELWGEPCYSIETIPSQSKNASCSKSFNKYVMDYDQLQEAVSSYAAVVGNKLRREKSIAMNVNVYLRTNKHNEDHEQYYPSTVVKLSHATNNTHDLTVAALTGLKRIYIPGYNFLKAGVIVTGILPQNEVQLNLLEEYSGTPHNAISGLIDQMNNRYGSGSIRYAVEGFEKKWRMKQDFLSPGYTTRWKDILHCK